MTQYNFFLQKELNRKTLYGGLGCEKIDMEAVVSLSKNYSKKKSPGSGTARSVIDNDTGIVYRSAVQAARAIGVAKSTLYKYIETKHNNGRYQFTSMDARKILHVPTGDIYFTKKEIKDKFNIGVKKLKKMLLEEITFKIFY